MLNSNNLLVNDGKFYYITCNKITFVFIKFIIVPLVTIWNSTLHSSIIIKVAIPQHSPVKNQH